MTTAPGSLPARVLGGSAVAVVVGATDPEATVDFLGVFGLVASEPIEVDRADARSLYGLEGPTMEVTLRTPGADVPEVSVVACGEAGGLPNDYQHGPRAFDIYTPTMDEAIEQLRFVGLEPGPVGTISVGPVTMKQCLVPGPDGLAVVLVESSHRRNSLLDDLPPEAGPRFSEGHSVVWCVAELDAEAQRLVEAGLVKGADLAFCGPEVSSYLDLPRSPVPIRMTMLSGSQVEPLRLELLEFPDDPGEDASTDGLRGGIWALRYRVPAIEPAVAALSAVGWHVRGTSQRGAWVQTPGGVRLTLVV